MNDMDCETQYNALCQVKLFTLFQLEGLCADCISDHNFIMTEVKNIAEHWVQHIYLFVLIGKSVLWLWFHHSLPRH